MSPFAAGQQGARLQKAKSDYGKMINRGQPGGSSSVSSQAKKATLDNLQRQKFFGGRDVPEERLRKRIKQDTLERQFKDRFTKPVIGSSNLLQMTADAPRSLAAERERLANLYGPTLREIGGDIAYGLGNIFKGFAEKGPPILQIIRGISDKFKGGVESAWDKVRGEPTSVQGTDFPQPSSDAKNYFSAIDTGIAQVDPNNMLVDIAKQDQRTYEPFRVSDMNMNNVVAQNNGLPSLIDMYNFATNPQLNTNYGNFRLDNVLSGDPTLGYQTDIFGGQLGLTAQPNQFGFTFEKAFNKGGSVNKHGGLGYMLK